MKIGLVDVDSKLPNLALMKISAYHKSLGDEVSFYNPLFDKPDRIYVSKVFTFTPDYVYIPEEIEVIKGGTGYDRKSALPEEVEKMCPDYELYNLNYSMGFLTRGCIRKCPWCFVPDKEGDIRPHQDIEEFLRHDKAVLLDNNVLACDFGIKQIEKIAKLGIKVDFNQGLDARLIDDTTAKLLAKVKWLKPVRLACDTEAMKPIVHKAVETLRWHNVNPKKYSVYTLITKDIEESKDRIRFIKGIGCDPFAQPFISETETPNDEQRRLARFTDRKEIFNTTTFEDYRG